MTDHDQYAQWDAAYVLGALSGGERAEYEEHLSGCAECRAAVAELAGLPGLLGQLSPAEAIAVESGGGTAGPGVALFADTLPMPEPPASLMPRLPRAWSSPQRQRWLAPVAAAAAALLIGGVGGYVASASRDAVPGGGPSSTLAVGSTRLAFAEVKASPMTAVVDVVPTSEGTDLRVECQYSPSTATTTTSGSGASMPGSSTGMLGSPTGMPGSMGSSGAPTTTRGREDGYPVRYAIWVIGRDGRQMQVKDWTARSGRIMHPSGITPWSVSEIAAVEIRLADTNDPVLRARLT